MVGRAECADPLSEMWRAPTKPEHRQVRCGGDDPTVDLSRGQGVHMYASASRALPSGPNLSPPTTTIASPTDAARRVTKV